MRQVNVTQALALRMLKRGAVIGNGPNGAWITERDGTVHPLHFASLCALGKRKLLRRVEPPGKFYAVTHWALRDQL